MKNPQKLAFLEVVGGLVLGLLARLAGATGSVFKRALPETKGLG